MILIKHKSFVKPLLLLAFWTAFAVFMAMQSYWVAVRFGRSTSFSQHLIGELIYSYVWLLLTPIVLRLCEQFMLERRKLTRNLLVHLAFSGIFAVVHKLGFAVISVFHLSTQGKAEFTWKTISAHAITFLDYGVMIYWMILLLYYAVIYYRRFQEKELRASQLEAQLAQAQLQALKMQLHPHFLFNTLNAISVLIPKNPDMARSMLGRLSDLLRLTLENAGAQTVSLQQELEFLEHYLQIEQTRFGDRLTVKMAIAPDTLAARVPNLILQPLVENAIRHGVTEKLGPALIEITASRNNGTLQLQVRDNGLGLNGDQTRDRQGIGLANTRSRLDQMYGQSYRFELANATGGGVVATLEIPVQWK